VVCIKPEPEKVNGFDEKKNHLPEDAESDPKHKQTNIHVIVLSHKKEIKNPSSLRIAEQPQSKNTPFPSPPTPGGLLRGPQKPAQTNTHP